MSAWKPENNMGIILASDAYEGMTSPLPYLGRSEASVHFAPDASEEEIADGVKWAERVNEEEKMHEKEHLKEIMEMQWDKGKLEYTGNLTAWTYRNGCIWPAKGTSKIPHNGYLMRRIACLRKQRS